MNYQNEYDRIRGMMAQNVVKDASIYNLVKRQKDIENFSYEGIAFMPFDKRIELVNKIGSNSNAKLEGHKVKLQKLGAKSIDSISH